MYEVERSRHRQNPLTLQLTKERHVYVLTGSPIIFPVPRNRGTVVTPGHTKTRTG
jgi:hypothetical protein